jgi:hypothetical protein
LTGQQRLRQILLVFEECEIKRTQEFTLRWSQDRGDSFQEGVRQQWNFSSPNATRETEHCAVDLSHVRLLDLTIERIEGLDRESVHGETAPNETADSARRRGRLKGSAAVGEKPFMQILRVTPAMQAGLVSSVAVDIVSSSTKGLKSEASTSAPAKP